MRDLHTKVALGASVICLFSMLAAIWEQSWQWGATGLLFWVVAFAAFMFPTENS